MFAVPVAVARAAMTVAREKSATVVDIKKEVHFAALKEHLLLQKVSNTASHAGTKKVLRVAAMTNVKLAIHVGCTKDRLFAVK